MAFSLSHTSFRSPSFFINQRMSSFFKHDVARVGAGRVESCTISVSAPIIDDMGNEHWVECTATEADCITAAQVALQCAKTLLDAAMKKLDSGQP